MDFSQLIDRDSFIRSVRRASVTLRDTSLVSNDDIIDIGINESYPRIALILVTTKAKDGSNSDKPILGGIGPTANYTDQMKEVQRVLDTSVYRDGIYRVAVALTASSCLKQIPLNSDVYLLDLAKDLEKQALSDLDRIMGLISEVGIVSKDQNTFDRAADGEPRIYVANALDLSTIKEEEFDLVIKESARTNSVRMHESIEIPESRVGLCWIGLTGTYLSASVQTGFFIKNGDTTEDLIERISLNINELSSIGSSSIIASPNRGPAISSNLSYSKKELYPDSGKNRDKSLYFDLAPRIHGIAFSSRTLSATFNKELVSIKFYSLEDVGAPLEFYLENRHLGIPLEGVVYGVIPQYKALDKQGPHSLLMEVDKQSASADPLNRSDEIDTFYFRVKKGEEPFSSSLRFRSSSPLYEGVTEWSIPIGPEDTEESIAFKVLEGMYQRHEECLLVGAMPNNNAVQIVPYSKSKYETRIAADVLDVPPYIEVATGNTMIPLTPYRSASRSVVVKIVPDQTKHLNDDATAPYGASTSAYRSLSKPMQGVYDRIGMLRRSREDPYVK